MEECELAFPLWSALLSMLLCYCAWVSKLSKSRCSLQPMTLFKVDVGGMLL